MKGIGSIQSLTPILASRIHAVVSDLPTFREHLDTLRSQNIRVLCLEDPIYPARLKAIPDPPAILCSLGEFTTFDVPCVAIVGTRQPTAEGIELTLELATALALTGFTVVSGLAQGIDTSAHAGTLAGGETIAVLGTDVLHVSPAKNRQLATDIQAHGCLLSEHPFRTSPSARTLVQRNRIISGLSLATLVIEAKKKGGTLHTALFAQAQGRPLLTCRWERTSEVREGTQKLIQNGVVAFAPYAVGTVVDMLQHPEQLETCRESRSRLE